VFLVEFRNHQVARRVRFGSCVVASDRLNGDLVGDAPHPQTPNRPTAAEPCHLAHRVAPGIVLWPLHLGIAHSQFLTALAPLLMVPVGLIFFREWPQWRSLRWGALSLVGIVLVLFNGRGQNTATWSGDVVVVIGVLILAGFMGFSKRSSSHNIDTWESMAIVMPLALVTATPVALGDAGSELWSLGADAWVAIALLSVLTGVIGHGLLYFAFRSVQVATISTVQVSQPAFAVLWGWVFLSEDTTAKQVPGMVLVTVGIGLVMWFSQRHQPLDAERPDDVVHDASTPVSS
jgi:drug/metabolite transporter (DMT)-like permease